MRQRPNPPKGIWKSPSRKENAFRIDADDAFIPPPSDFPLVYTDDAPFEYTDGTDIEYA